jgi:hypothetical protein
MYSSSLDPHCETPRVQRRQRQVLWLCVAFTTWWLLAFAAAESGQLSNPVLAVAAAAVQLGLGLGLVAGYQRFLADADELRRKIELEALAWGAGVTVAGAFSMALLQSSGLVPTSVVIASFSLPFLVYGAVLTHRLRSYA